jgi:Ca2+-binding EF-hand superfamily protein
MSSTVAGSTLTQQLYMRLFDRLNTNGDDALSVGEVGVLDAQNVESSKVFKVLDGDGDGRVTRSEMTPSDTFGPETLASLISAQSGADDEAASPSMEILAALFNRADLDGDGALNADEMQAESDLRKAANLDAGYGSGPVFMPVDRNDDGLFTKDEIGVGQQIRSLELPASAIRFFDELPGDMQQRIQAARKQMDLPPLKPLTDEEKTAQRDQWAADRAERASGPEGTTKFLSREIEGLRADASAAYAARAQLSDSLSQRMMQQILGDAWKTDTSA